MNEERLVHRLEAFSDVVIGFVLAELAITLSVPKTMPAPADLLPSLFVFASTFALVVIVWYLHNRLFALYFVPNFVMVALNFIMLGGVIVMAYVLQVATRFSGEPGDIHLFGMWSECFAGVYFLIGVMYGIGTYLRDRALQPKDFAAGVFRCITCALGAAALLLVGLSASKIHHAYELHEVFIALAVFVVLSGALRRFGVPWLAARHAARA